MLEISGVTVIWGVRRMALSEGRSGKVSDASDICGVSWLEDDILELILISAMSKLAGVKEQLELEHSEQSEAEEGSQGVRTLFLLRERRRIRVFLDGISTLREVSKIIHFKWRILLIPRIRASTAGGARPKSRT
jgi:hypothetical protein